MDTGAELILLLRCYEAAGDVLCMLSGHGSGSQDGRDQEAAGHGRGHPPILSRGVCHHAQPCSTIAGRRQSLRRLRRSLSLQLSRPSPTEALLHIKEWSLGHSRRCTPDQSTCAAMIHGPVATADGAAVHAMEVASC